MTFSYHKNQPTYTHQTKGSEQTFYSECQSPFNGPHNTVVHMSIKIQAERSRQSSELYSTNTSTQLTLQHWPQCTVQILIRHTLPSSVKNMTVNAFKGTVNLKPSVLGSS
jgi:hypothetical protein